MRLPDDAMLREKRSENALGGLNVGWFEGHDYLYSKVFSLSAEEAERHHVLEFEGVYRKAEVRINGQKAAYWPYGYSNFYVECDEFFHAGENLIEVIARNADQPNSRWYSGAGIYRPVRLWSSGKEYIALNGVRITTLSLDPARIRVDVTTSGDGPVKVEVLENVTAGSLIRDVPECTGVDGVDVARGVRDCAKAAAGEGLAGASADVRVLACAEGEGRTFELEIPDAVAWSPDTPHLYTCRVSYQDDTAAETFGIRTISWGKDGFLINGERVILRGACIHHDNGLLGAACHPDAEERRIRLLQENGYNAIRSAHNPCSKIMLEACDRLGVLVLDEYADMWYIHKTRFDYAGDFAKWWQKDITAMVDKDFNHPSVIMYSIGNEVGETAQKKGIALTREMKEFLNQLDPGRPVTCGINIFFNFLNSIGFGWYSDEKAEKEAARNAKAKEAGKKTKERSTGSKFFNDLTGMVGADFMKFGATLHGSDVTTRKAYGILDVAGYNYGEKRYKKDLRKYPDRLILGSETFCADAYRFWELAKKEPRLIGDFVWAGIDYLGEVMIGAWEYPDYAPSFDQGPGWISAGSGRIDLTGKPLGEAYYTRVALEREAGPYIAVRPICHEGSHSPSAWKMTNAMRSWSFRGFEGKPAQVEVYARCASLELVLNGRSLGRKSAGVSRTTAGDGRTATNDGCPTAGDGRTATGAKDCIFRFKVPYENGMLEAIAYDASGTEIGRDLLMTAGEETLLRLEPEQPLGEKSSVAPDRELRCGEKSSVAPDREPRCGEKSSVAPDRELRCGVKSNNAPDREQVSVEKGHLAFVRLRLTDGAGITKVTERAEIRLEVEGGRLAACGSACPYYEHDYLSSICDTYYGEALAIVEVQGDVTLKAESTFGRAEVRISAK